MVCQLFPASSFVWVKCSVLSLDGNHRENWNRTWKDLYRWNWGKSKSFSLTLIFFSVLINKLHYYGTIDSPILLIWIQYSLETIAAFTSLCIKARCVSMRLLYKAGNTNLPVGGSITYRQSPDTLAELAHTKKYLLQSTTASSKLV
jgi:hypothetical protein